MHSQRIKDAICDKFVATRRKKPSVNTEHPNIRINAFLDQHTVTFYLNTSGEPLFKRGCRVCLSAAARKPGCYDSPSGRVQWETDQATPLKESMSNLGGSINKGSSSPTNLRQYCYFLAYMS